MNPFFEQVYDVVAQIPCGKVASYGQIARLLGRPRAAREVGWAMRCCPEHWYVENKEVIACTNSPPEGQGLQACPNQLCELPWQRVVMADGSITGGVYAEIRKTLLESEGITFLPDGRVDMAACRWLG